MQEMTFGEILVRALGFTFALAVLPTKVVTFQTRLSLLVVLVISGIRFEDSATLLKILNISSFTGLLQLFPPLGISTLNFAIGVSIAVLLSISVWSAFVAGRWISDSIQSRFSLNPCCSDKEDEKEIVLPIFLALTVISSDYLFYAFSSFSRSFSLLNNSAQDLSVSTPNSIVFSQTVVSAGSELISMAFFASFFLFLAATIISVVVIVGVKFCSAAAVTIADSGLTFIFMTMIFSLTVYATTSVIETSQIRVEQLLMSENGFFEQLEVRETR